MSSDPYETFHSPTETRGVDFAVAITNARVGLSLHNTSDPRPLIYPPPPNRHARRAAAAQARNR